MPKPRQPFPVLVIRIDITPEARIGHGKIELLEAIALYGSIAAAARIMNMSYKRAWDLIEDINRIVGRDVTERQVGGKDGGGAALSGSGFDLIKRYRLIERIASTAARDDLIAIKSSIEQGGSCWYRIRSSGRAN